MRLENLADLNALLNATSAVLLAAGYWAVKTRRLELHARLMASAFGVSCLFLASYVTYHYLVGHTKYGGEGWVKAVYLTILATHIVLAAVTVPLVITTLVLAARKSLDRHRKLARWTLPIWGYVSVTGVIIYVMLYWL